MLSSCEHSQVFSLSQKELDRGLVACSSGNFALALLHACAAICRPGRQEHLPRDCSVNNLKQALLSHQIYGSVSQACGCREVCLRTCAQLSGQVWTVAGQHYGRRSSWPQMQRPPKYRCSRTWAHMCAFSLDSCLHAEPGAMHNHLHIAQTSRRGPHVNLAAFFVDEQNERPAINGLQVVRHGGDVVQAEMEARRHADQGGAATKIYCSPYNDLQARSLGACSM